MAGSPPTPDPSGSLKRDVPGTGSLGFTVVAAALTVSETHAPAEGIPA